MSLQDIVRVTITKETAALTRAGFGTPGILAFFSTSHFADRARVYDSLDAIKGDGFGTDHFVYKIAAKIFSQNPKIGQVVVCRRALPVTREVDLTPVTPPQPTTVYAVTINDQVASFTTDATPTVAEITAGLTSAINALAPSAWVTATSYAVNNRVSSNGNIYKATQAGLSGATGPSGTRSDVVDGTVKWAYVGPVVAATDGTTKVTVEQSTAGAPFVCLPSSRALLTQKDVTVDPGIVADLSACRTDLSGNDTWYMLTTDAHSADEIEALAAEIETLRKMALCSCSDDDLLTSATTDLGSTLAALGYARSALVYHEDAGGAIEAAWTGKVLPLDPGSETWKFKTLVGVAASKLTPNEENNLKNKSVNRYQTVAGVDIMAEGVTTSGEFIDVTRFLDWLQADMEEHVFAALAKLPKVAYTNAGISIVDSEVRASLQRGIANGGLAADPEPTVTVPLVKDVDPLDKLARRLRNVKFSATLAGAIYSAEITGTLTV